MRVLFGSWPAYGHLFPMLPLAQAAYATDGSLVYVGYLSAGRKAEGATKSATENEPRKSP